MSAELDGMRQLRDTLERVKTEMRAKAQREIKRAALNVENGAKRRVPVDTGRLRNSISHRMTDEGLNAEVGTNVKYARRIEFGFHGPDSLGREYSQAAQPYLFPALEEERPRLLGRLRSLDINVRR